MDRTGGEDKSTRAYPYPQYPQYSKKDYIDVLGTPIGDFHSRESEGCALCEKQEGETNTHKQVIIGAPPALDALQWQHASRSKASPIGYQFRSICHLLHKTIDPLRLPDEETMRAQNNRGTSARFEVGDEALRETCLRAQMLDKYCDRRVGLRGLRSTCKRPADEVSRITPSPSVKDSTPTSAAAS